MHLKDFFQALFGIVLCGAAIMALIIVLFGNNTGSFIQNRQPPLSESAPAEDQETSFAPELIPPPEVFTDYQVKPDELLYGDAFNQPKKATGSMFSETAFSPAVSQGNSSAPSRIIVHKSGSEPYVWCEFEYDPAGEWMKQRVYPLDEGQSAYEILYDKEGNATRVGIGRKQLISYDELGFPTEGIGIDREGRYRYFTREDTDLAYDANRYPAERDMLYFVNHSDPPAFKIELEEDLYTHTREEKYYEQRIIGGQLHITQHRVTDESGRMRRIVDFSKFDNAEPLLQAIREFDSFGRLMSHREYDANRNVTMEELFTYNPETGQLKEHVFSTKIVPPVASVSADNAEGGEEPETAGAEAQETAAPANAQEAAPANRSNIEISYKDYFDRPDSHTVRRVSLNEARGESEEMIYHLETDASGNLTRIQSEGGNTERNEIWTYDPNGDWTSYTAVVNDRPVLQVKTAYCETAYPYQAGRMQRRVLSLEALQYAAFSDNFSRDAESFWWCSPDCPVEERFVRSGLFF